jgi:hypothetical protein
MVVRAMSRFMERPYGTVTHPVGSENASERGCTHPNPNNPQGRIRVIILGLILLILGFVFGISILWTIGIILLVVGAVLYLLGATGRAVGGRNHYY